MRLMSGRRDVSGGVADADERADGGGALRRGARGDVGGAGVTNHRGGVEAGGWQEADLKTRPKGVSEGGFGGSLAGGDGDDGGVDRQASGDGHARGYLNHLLYRRRKLGGE